MATAADVVQYLCVLAEAETVPPELPELSPWQLQRLLYYCQGCFIAWYGKPLFSDPIYACHNGPVVESFLRGLSPLSENGLDESESEAVAKVWQDYGGFTGAQLRWMIQQEPPWRNAYLGNDVNANPESSNSQRARSNGKTVAYASARAKKASVRSPLPQPIPDVDERKIEISLHALDLYFGLTFEKRSGLHRGIAAEIAADIAERRVYSEAEAMAILEQQWPV